MGGGGWTAPLAVVDTLTGGTGVFSTIGQTIDSKKASKKERRAAEDQQALEQQAIAEQKQAALETRKAQINSLREQMSSIGDSTKSSSGKTGVRAVVSDNTLG